LINLYEHQKEAVDKLQTGSILRGGVGSGKSLTSIAYFTEKVCDYMVNSKNLYIITTARKRDTKDWEKELEVFDLYTDELSNPNNIQIHIDSWNNIKKYVDVENSFFIFDEQRVVGYGAWTKSFLKITKKNDWILLSATPGDVWMDYMPVFIANGFYKHKTEFLRTHVVYSRYSKFPKIDRYIEISKLRRYRKKINVNMKYDRHTIQHHIELFAPYDDNKFFLVKEKRWNVFENKPIKDVAELFRIMRKLVNSDLRRILLIKQLILKNKKTIIFYNFNYELDLLRELTENIGINTKEWNGHKHEQIPETKSWVYLVQYTAGAEGWNCVETNVVIFYSQNYSYKIMSQAAGRIDRINTSFVDLYYYHIKSKSFIDFSISKALKNKKNFQEKDY
jgi:hypothetical protein